MQKKDVLFLFIRDLDSVGEVFTNVSFSSLPDTWRFLLFTLLKLCDVITISNQPDVTTVTLWAKSLH